VGTELFLIEDNPGDANLVRAVLTEYPHPVTVRVAENGEQALKVLGDEAYRPDLIILDLNIPRIPGIALLERVPARKAPVVIFSSEGNQAEIARAMQLGACEFVQKPIDLDEFAEAIKGVVERWARKANSATGSVN
jgi:DNA-binding NtrC family response regulator